MNAGTQRAFWDQIEEIFDPELPAEQALFAEREPDYNPLAKLVELLEIETQTLRRYLVIGAVGNGKTSELYHFGAQLAERRMIVLVDLWRHFASTIGDSKALERLQTWELLGLVGVALYRAGVDRFGHKWKHEPKQLQQALEKVRKSEGGEGPEIDVAKLSKAMVVVASAAVGALAAGPAGLALGAVADTGLKVLDDPSENIYPMPMLTTDDATIHVGRVRALGERVQLVAATDNAFRVAESAIDIAFELADRD